MPDWSIKFVPAKNPTPNRLADFVLDAPGPTGPSGPFNVFAGDLVSWNNATGATHRPAVFGPVGPTGPIGPTGPTPIGATLAPRASSPAYPVAALPFGTTIRFFCTLHSGEVGTLVVAQPTGPTGPTGLGV